MAFMTREQLVAFGLTDEQVENVMKEHGKAMSEVLGKAETGNDYTEHTALNNGLKVSDWNIDKALVLCKGNIEQKEKITYLPWYMMMFIKQKRINKMIYEIEVNNV